MVTIAVRHCELELMAEIRAAHTFQQIPHEVTWRI